MKYFSTRDKSLKFSFKDIVCILLLFNWIFLSKSIKNFFDYLSLQTNLPEIVKAFTTPVLASRSVSPFKRFLPASIKSLTIVERWCYSFFTTNF